jgi:precorrin-4/cobalt-precorrin-4 C11-methyltransferase
MRVYFVGAGPGAADLITVRGAQILARVPMVLYAGSLVSREMLTHCRANTEIIDTAKLNLDEQEGHYIRARERAWDVVRLHSGDPSIYGATAEQMRRLDALNIEYEVIPGVSSFVAAAAVLNAELTKPEVIIITRTSGRASGVPEKESLKSLATHRATLCIFLSGANLPQVVADLLTSYSTETPFALVQKATWPQEKIHRGTLGKMLDEINACDWQLSTMLLVGEVLDEKLMMESRLYSAEYSHRFRKASRSFCV